MAFHAETIGLFMSPEYITGVIEGDKDGATTAHLSHSVRTPDGAVIASGIADPSMVGHTIKVLLKDMGVTPSRARVAIMSQSTGMKALRLPDVPTGEQRTLVSGDLVLSGHIPTGRDEFAYLWCPAEDDQGRKQADVYAFVTDAATIEAIRETVSVAGLTLVGAEPEPVAMCRACLANHKSPCAVLLPSSRHFDLFMFDGDRIRSVRRIQIGADDVLPSNVSHVDLDAHKTNLDGTPSDSTAHGDEFATYGTTVASSSASSSFLVNEVARSLAFFSREFPDFADQMGLLVASSDGRADEIAKILDGRVSVPTSAFVANSDVIFDATPTGPAQGDGYTPALGAAINPADSVIPLIDLATLSDSARSDRRTPLVLVAGMGISAIWLTGSIAAAITIMLMTMHLNRDKAAADTEIKSIEAVRAPLLEKQETWQAVQQARSISALPVSSILGRVAAASNSGVSITSLKAGQDGKVSLEGIATSTKAMEQFSNDLGQGTVIKSPIFDSMRQDAKGVYFKITGIVKAAAPKTQGKAGR